MSMPSDRPSPEVDDDFDLHNELLMKISLGDSLKDSLTNVSHIKGALKLQRKVIQEINFLRRVLEGKCVKAVHVKCSNLSHLEAHVKYVLKDCDNCTSILETFEVQTPDETRRLCVDIVKDDGYTWVKVIARNARALTMSSSGDCEHGQRTIIDKAKEFLLCAEQHPHHFKTPKVEFIFAGGIEVPLAISLEKLNIEVHGKRILQHDTVHPDSDSDTDFVERCSLPVPVEQIVTEHSGGHVSPQFNQSLNLDITAMIAYVSALTNGGSDAQFEEFLLNQQAQWERERPVKPVLEKLFEDKKLYCCQTAHDDFQKIIHTLGGPAEKHRAENLLRRVFVVPDQLSDRTRRYLKEVGKIKARSKLIFGTGDEIKAVTVTANQGFVRAAKSQGFAFSVIYHESRALTEQKAVSLLS